MLLFNDALKLQFDVVEMLQAPGHAWVFALGYLRENGQRPGINKGGRRILRQTTDDRQLFQEVTAGHLHMIVRMLLAPRLTSQKFGGEGPERISKLFILPVQRVQIAEVVQVAGGFLYLGAKHEIKAIAQFPKTEN